MSDFDVWDGVVGVLLSFQPFTPSAVDLRLIDTNLLADPSSCRHRAYERRCFDDDFAEWTLLTLRDVLQVRGEEVARLGCLTVAFRSKESVWVALVLLQILRTLVGTLPMSDDEAVASNLAGLRLSGCFLRSLAVQHRGRLWHRTPLMTCSRVIANTPTTTHF